MRKAETTQKVQWAAPDVVTKVIPAPTGGWDAITPLAEMDPKRAPILDNWIPRPGYVELRPGYLPYAIISTSPVNALMVYRSPTGEKLFAASGDGIYNISTQTAVTKDVSGLSNSQFQYVNFTPNAGTTVIQCVNGSDSLQQYDGSTWTVPSITGLPSGTSASIINIHAQKQRLWYVLNQSSTVAFMPTDAISGPIAGTIELGNSWVRGGYCVTMATWALDGGNGPQDYAAFISSEGEVTIFMGTDPTDAANWSIAGTFLLAPPVSRRCTLQVGSDVAVITQQGVLPLSQALPFDPSADRSVAITARIQNAMAQAVQIGGSFFGWQIVSYSSQQLAIINVPTVSNSTSVQFVMNVLTGAWCRFTGWNAACFAVFNDDLYFGDFSGNINTAFTSSTDGPNAILYDMQCAFNWFDDPGRTKRVTMAQPLMVSSGTITPTLTFDEDFGTSTTAAPLSDISGTTLWDVAIWDQSLWSGNLQTLTQWYSVQAIGHALAARMKFSHQPQANNGDFDIAQFDNATFDTSVEPAATLQVNAFNSILELGGFI